MHFEVDVAYVAPSGALVMRRCTVAEGATLDMAVRRSAIAEDVPNTIDIFALKWGINGMIVAPDSQVQKGDRIEIYNPVSQKSRAFAKERANAHKQEKFSQY